MADLAPPHYQQIVKSDMAAPTPPQNDADPPAYVPAPEYHSQMPTGSGIVKIDIHTQFGQDFDFKSSIATHVECRADQTSSTAMCYIESWESGTAHALISGTTNRISNLHHPHNAQTLPHRRPDTVDSIRSFIIHNANSFIAANLIPRLPGILYNADSAVGPQDCVSYINLHEGPASSQLALRVHSHIDDVAAWPMTIVSNVYVEFGFQGPFQGVGSFRNKKIGVAVTSTVSWKSE